MRRWPTGNGDASQVNDQLSVGTNWEKMRSNKDINKRRQQAAESDGLILIEAMHTSLKRRKFDFRNWLQFSKNKLQDPGG